MTPEGQLFAEIWDEIATEYLKEFAYMGECASLNFHISVQQTNVYIQWSGYDDSMPAFVSGLVERLEKMREENLESIFTQVKEKMIQKWTNHYLQNTYRRAYSERSTIFKTGQVEKSML